MMRTLLCTVALALGLAMLVPSEPPDVSPPAKSSSAILAAPERASAPVAAGNGLAGAELARAADGHFYADATVNGARIRMMVDTGATTVALTRADAQAAGLQFAAGDFTATGQGAGGELRLKPVTLDRVAIGPVAATGVQAVIAEDRLPVSLVGQSFLSRVSRVEIVGDRMVLR